MIKAFLFSIAITLLLVSAVIAQDVQFFQGTWEEVLKKAKEDNKYIMVDAYTDWCGPCKRMDKEKFHGNVEVADFINQNFVPYKANCEKSPSDAIAKKFKVISYPTLLFFNPDGQLVSRSLGYNANQNLFLDPFKEALLIKDKKVFDYDSKKLDPGFPAIYTDAFKVDDKPVVRHTLDEVVQYLDQQKNKFSEVTWAVMYVYSFPGKYEQFFIDNYSKYNSLYRSEASDAIRRIASNLANDAIKNANEQKMDSAVAMVQKYIPEKAADVVPMWQISFYQSTAQWKKYADVIESELQKDPQADLFLVNRFCWIVYQQCNDPEVINRAIGWLERRESELKTYDLLDTYASLLYKGNRFEDAEEYAMKAIEVGESDDKNVSKTKELLVKVQAAKNK